MVKSRIAVVIPAFNEEQTIAKIIKKVSKYGMPIVVNDGSTDNTEIRAKRANAIVVNHVFNEGYDEALNSGLKKAFSLGNDIAVTFDADGQHSPELIPVFLNKIYKGADIVVGNRNKQQRISEKVFSIYTNLLYKIRDPLCGMKAYTKNVFLDLNHLVHSNSIGTGLTILGAKNNFKIMQVDININERKDTPRFASSYMAEYKILKAMIITIGKIRKISKN